MRKILIIVVVFLTFIFITDKSNACRTGGRGSSSCSFGWTIMGTGISSGVTCPDGTYACCGFNGAGCVFMDQSWIGRKWDEIWA